LGWVGQLIERQSTLLAYIDVFGVAAIFAAIMVPLALVPLRPVHTRAATTY
jgi:DHA2 family multidrug resistance protein